MPDGPTPLETSGADLLAAQRAAFLADGPPDRAARRDALGRLKSALLAHRKRLQAAAMEDFGNRAPEESAIIDIGPTVQSINHMQGRLRRWMRPQRRHVPLLMQPGRARVEYQPLGVVGILTPWNYPVTLALTPLATALAAGNRALIKPSELAPATADALCALVAEAFSPEEVAVVTGGADVAAAFSALPFDHLIFTGSTAVGRHVMRAAADTLTPVTLELGGKSPVVVLPDADLDLLGADLAFGKATNAGQTCIAPDYVLAQPDQVQPLVDRFTAALRKSYPGGLADKNLTTIITERHRDRLLSLLEDARAKGAEVISPLSGEAAHPRAIGPALILGATPQMQIMQEEIFGPLLPIVTAGTTDEAIAYVNARPRPLALYVYGKDRGAIDTVLTRTTSGNATINAVLLHFAVDTLPFGGVGDSGIGAYHGDEGFYRLSHAKGIYAPAKPHGSRLLRPPYGRLSRLIGRIMMR